jgi:phosphatidyl-myo-inositol dimannoside synthase
MTVSGARVLALVSDAHGGFGGISQYNRDVLEAMSGFDSVEDVSVLPRLAHEKLGAVPDKVRYDLRGLGGRFRYLRSVFRHLRENSSFDLIYCAHINLLPAAMLARFYSSAPVVLAVYGVDVWERQSSFVRWQVQRFVSAIVSISAVTRDRMMRWCAVSPDKIHIVPNAIQLEDYGSGPKCPSLLARYSLDGKTVLMTLGRMVGQDRAKGFDEVLEVLPRLISDIPDIAYIAAGDGPDRPRLEAKASALGVADRVVFTGRVDEEKKADLFRLADLYVMPSRGEGFGFVVLEALACGVPVAASQSDGTREAVLDGRLGVVVDPEDPDSIRLGILKALKRPRGVPPGLAHFAFDRFSDRLRSSLASVCNI